MALAPSQCDHGSLDRTIIVRSATVSGGRAYRNMQQPRIVQVKLFDEKELKS